MTAQGKLRLSKVLFLRFGMANLSGRCPAGFASY
jgi:hypothetical protein